MFGHSDLLAEEDGYPVSEDNLRGAGDIVLICEHASHKLPRRLGTLGLTPEASSAHIAWDPGALGVATLLSGMLDARLIHQNFSRLAYDCNRPPDAADAMPAKSEIYDIPGNVSLSQADRLQRTNAIYEPFRYAISTAIAERQASGRPTVLVTVHSFTPVFNGKSRDVELGILHDADSRLADAMLDLAKIDTQYTVRRNEPYGPADGVTHTLREHGLANGLLNVMIEIRNDLIDDPAGQRRAADYLAGLLATAIAAVGEAHTG